VDVRPVVLIDIDGVLADVRHRVRHVERRPKDWDAFFAAAVDDPPLPDGIALVLSLAAEADVVYLTGRPERCRADTVRWLAEQSLPAGELLMRRDDDRRPARLTKLGVARRLRRRGVVRLAVDDDAAVVRALRDDGFEVLHATWMEGGTDGVDSSPAQQVLFEAQEDDGRT
jgi:phosphoglycolate phosphatase-like HAD superfamily hydrolase